MSEPHHTVINYNVTGTTCSAYCDCGWEHHEEGPGARTHTETATQQHQETQ